VQAPPVLIQDGRLSFSLLRSSADPVEYTVLIWLTRLSIPAHPLEDAEMNFNEGDYERTLFKQSQDALVSEWSITSGLSQSETRAVINGCLEHRK
jgi:hypothetical protein